MKEFLPETVPLPQDPIFVVGYPRSGTTLLQALLSIQQGVYSLPETHFFNVVEKKIEVDEAGTIRPSCLEAVFESIHDKMAFRFSPAETGVIRDCAAKRKLTSKTLFEWIVYKFIGQDLDKTAANPRGAGAYRWLEKTPNHIYFAERIYSLYPDVQFINIIRHPAAAVLSRKKHFPFNKNTPLITLIEMWKRSIRCAEDFRESHPGSIYTLKYEELVKNPAKKLNMICRFLKINFNEIMMDGYKNTPQKFILPFETWKNDVLRKRIGNTNSSYFNISNKEAICTIQDLLGAEMARYGYENVEGIEC